MVLPKSKNAVGLGNSLMNDRFGKGKGQDMRRGPQGIPRTGPDGQTYITTPKKEAAWMKMRSVTEQAALDEFLSTAELAGTDFKAEKMNNVKIIHRDQHNPFLLSASDERAAVRKQNANRSRLKVPRRPQWDEHTTPNELDEKERESLIQWRRDLAALQENDDLLMTPFERNIEVWRQLWRVIERSDLVVQIVDARNPLLFRCEDLEHYVKEVDNRKKNLLLVNKADMMTPKQRQIWATYFEKAGINFRFFSAELAKDINEAKNILEGSDTDREDDSSDEGDNTFSVEDEQAEEEEEETYSDNDDENDEDDEDDEDDSVEEDSEEKRSVRDFDPVMLTKAAEAMDIPEPEAKRPSTSKGETSPSVWPHIDESIRILTTDELEAIFLEHAPLIERDQDGELRKTQIGLVGYPNVGKSSTINALVGSKKVSVSATPGKTKHFQTIHLSESVILCDCPGLVFPNFATTKAELVCNGVLPIDQLREYTGPAALVAQRIPRPFLEAVYGMKISTRPLEEGGTGFPTGEEILAAYAAARGFFTTGQGQPDESRAARYVLKDYVKGKLLFCHPPPTEPPVDVHAFNRELYDSGEITLKRKAMLASHQAEDANEVGDASLMDGNVVRMAGTKSQHLDKGFFKPGTRSTGHMPRPFQHKYTEQGLASGKQLSGRKHKAMVALTAGVDPEEIKTNGKKHYKANKRKAKKTEAAYV